MDNNNHRSILLPSIILAGFSLLVTGCQQNPENQSSEIQYHTLPNVQAKYDEEVLNDFNNRIARNNTNRYEGLVVTGKPILEEPQTLPNFLFFDTGIDIPYPEDGVKGIYLTSENVGDQEYFNWVVQYINETELNSVVIDFKDDWGNIIPPVESDNPLIQETNIQTVDYKAVMKILEENQIYPIARIVTFKDPSLANLRPDLSFHDPVTNDVWMDANGSSFINPFKRETWEYNLAVAEEAAKMGFRDIQFDYIRFPEGFETIADDLEYDLDGYESFVSDDPEQDGIERVAAINDFLTYASKRLKPYNVDVSADIFGYTAIAGNAPDVRGIGQNFAMMAENVDVVSSMIYPSHWTAGFFGFDYPDLYPYEFVDTYIQEELFVLENVENPVVSRPWVQDFTASHLPWGTYLEYGPNEVQAQIQALKNNGINEYLIWNAAGEYSQGVDYNPDAQVVEE